MTDELRLERTFDATRLRLAAAGVEVWAERDGAAGRSLHFSDVAGTIIVAAELPA